MDIFYNGPSYECHTVEGSSSSGKKAAFLLDRLDDLSARQPRRLLDFGCGSGAFLVHAAERNWEVAGFEPGERGRLSGQRLGFSVAGNLDEVAGPFDLITLHHVFEHLEDPVAILQRLRTLLAPEGHIFIEVPNVASLRSRLATDTVRQMFPRVDERHRAFPIHLMYYTTRSMAAVMERASFELERTFTVGLGMDEFLLPAQSSAQCGRAPSNATHFRQRHSSGAARPSSALPRQRSTLKARARDMFLATGLGENLAVVVRPK